MTGSPILPADTAMGAVTLWVADLDAMVAWECDYSRGLIPSRRSLSTFYGSEVPYSSNENRVHRRSGESLRMASRGEDAHQISRR